MLTLLSNNYLTRHPIESAMKEFAKSFTKNQKVLDIGCGEKPYAKYFSCQYIGLDSSPKVGAEIVANASEIPCQNNEFDGVIFNQALEHIIETEKTIAEIKRVLKPGGLCIVTVPQTVMVHSTPLSSDEAPLGNFDKKQIPFWHADYYRFTRYGLISLFRDFQLINIRPDTYFFGTIFQLFNYFFAAFGAGVIFSPIYFINNCLGLLADKLTLFISYIPLSFFRKFRFFILESLTINNIAIFKKND